MSYPPNRADRFFAWQSRRPINLYKQTGRRVLPMPVRRLLPPREISKCRVAGSERLSRPRGARRRRSPTRQACRRRAHVSMRVGCALAGASSFFSPPPSDAFLNRSKFESFEMLSRTGRSPDHAIWCCSLLPSCRLVQLREGSVDSVGGLSGIGNTAFEAPLIGVRLGDRRALRRNGKCTSPRTWCDQAKRVAANFG
jgi:hypothetical protein